MNTQERDIKKQHAKIKIDEQAERELKVLIKMKGRDPGLDSVSPLEMSKDFRREIDEMSYMLVRSPVNNLHSLVKGAGGSKPRLK